jgi:hypothetical protein
MCDRMQPCKIVAGDVVVCQQSSSKIFSQTDHDAALLLLLVKYHGILMRSPGVRPARGYAACGRGVQDDEKF